MAEHGGVHVLVVEDDRRFARLLARRLAGQGFETTLAFTGPEGLERAASNGADLAVVDVMLPGMDGFQLVRSLRDRGCQLPILMLTARDAVDDRVTGLQAGADDYLIKPFAFAELLARIEALTRRAGTSQRLAYGPVEIDVPAHRVTAGGVPVELTPKEFELLECLVRSAGRVLSRIEIKEYVWGFHFDAPTKVVDLYVHYLRRKLEAAGVRDLIETVRGVGYSIGR
jgi:two-component system, OmpR family, response regulator